MAEHFATLPSGYGFTGPVPAGAPVMRPASAVTAAPATAYQGLLDRLHLASHAISSPAAPPMSPAAPSLPSLSGLFDQLKALLDRWLSPSAPPSTPPMTVPPPPSMSPTPAPPPQTATRRTDFVISSFNVLGSSHTRGPGSDRPGMAPGTTRIRTAAELLERHDVDIVGFQEFQRDQFTEFQKVAGKTFAVYPGFQLGKPEVVNSIAWRKDTWDLVKADHIEIPYFNGQKRKMPVIRLRHKETGQEAYFANFHNPASTRKYGDQERWRDVATDQQIALVNRLRRETGLPVFITGDMNEREEYFDRMTRGADMVSADTGPKGQRPKKMGIDWIFGSEGVSFSSYQRDRSALVQKTSDHPMIVSKARIRG